MKRTQPPETEVVKTAEICKKFVRNQVILFLAGFSHLEPLFNVGRLRRRYTRLPFRLGTKYFSVPEVIFLQAPEFSG